MGVWWRAAVARESEGGEGCRDAEVIYLKLACAGGRREKQFPSIFVELDPHLNWFLLLLFSLFCLS